VPASKKITFDGLFSNKKGSTTQKRMFI